MIFLVEYHSTKENENKVFDIVNNGLKLIADNRNHAYKFWDDLMKK